MNVDFVKEPRMCIDQQVQLAGKGYVTSEVTGTSKKEQIQYLCMTAALVNVKVKATARLETW